MRERLKNLIEKHSLLSNKMLDPNVFNNQKELLKITKEHSSLDQIVKLGKKYLSMLKTIQDDKKILEENDEELKEIAQEEIMDLEVELIYNPEIPPERVGQATLLDPPRMLWNATGFDWYHNQINATFKSGILYEGWGQVNDKVFHDFPSDGMAMHYCPWEMQKHVLDSGVLAKISLIWVNKPVYVAGLDLGVFPIGL